jgi:hypothetical protein
VTALVPRKQLAFLTVITGILFALGIGIALKSNSTPGIVIAGTSFSLETADTEVLKQKGLSGRENITADQAMLFVFDEPKQHCFWMKDMQFNIDMIWLDANKKVVAIEQNVSPETYPNSYCHDGQYVVEVAANRAAALGLNTGDKLKF